MEGKGALLWRETRLKEENTRSRTRKSRVLPHLSARYTQELKQALFDSIQNSFWSRLVVSAHFSDGETEDQRDPTRPPFSASSPVPLPERCRPAIPTAGTIVV